MKSKIIEKPDEIQIEVNDLENTSLSITKHKLLNNETYFTFEVGEDGTYNCVALSEGEIVKVMIKIMEFVSEDLKVNFIDKEK